MKQSATLCTALLLCCLLIILPRIQGSPLFKNIRCQCIKFHDIIPHVKYLEKLEVIPAGSSCGRTEIIVTLKRTKEQRCLNPDSVHMKNLIKSIKVTRPKETSNQKQRSPERRTRM
ncbi:C-X-C motif chemokine 10-like [Macrotis lagotis]|uniref:C-X-C motif chemokine 10-like n=1 Tax=Macrotis lagotis TaxID=92651 RepID=UPI003D6994A0